MLFYAGVLLAIVAAYVVYIMVREFLNKTRLSRYKKQGFAIQYNAFLGETKALIDAQKFNDQHKIFEDLATTHRGSPGLVFNHSSGHRSWIHLLDVDLVREYLSIENEVSYRLLMLDLKAPIGFIMVGGDAALHQRTIFSSIFSQNNLTRIAPQIRKLVKNHFEKSGIQNSLTEKLSVGTFQNSNQFLEGLMRNFSQDLVYHDSLPVPKAKSGLSPAEELVQIVDLVFGERGGLHPLNLIFEGLPHKYNLLPGSREASIRGAHLIKILKDFITKRQETIEKSGYEKYDSSKFNIIDAMILHNHEARVQNKPQEILTLDEMAGNCNMFTFASFDTTLTTCSSIFFHLAQDPQLQEELYKQIHKSGLQDGITSMEQIDTCELLTDVIMESLRIFPPGPLSFDRIILKDFKLGKYQFFKGDLINVSFAASMWNPEKFASERQFKVGSCQPSNKKYFMPFSSGRRGCIGKVLAELELKQLLIYTVCNYKLEPRSKPEEVKYYFNLAMKLDNCYVKLVPRK